MLLGAGAVAVVAAGAASLTLGGWPVPTALGALTAVASLRCARRDLHASAETLAVASVALAAFALGATVVGWVAVGVVPETAGTESAE